MFCFRQDGVGLAGRCCAPVPLRRFSMSTRSFPPTVRWSLWSWNVLCLLGTATVYRRVLVNNYVYWGVVHQCRPKQPGLRGPAIPIQPFPTPSTVTWAKPRSAKCRRPAVSPSLWFPHFLSSYSVWMSKRLFRNLNKGGLLKCYLNWVAGQIFHIIKNIRGGFCM